MPFLDPTGSPSYKNHEEHAADDVETGRVSMPPWRYPVSTGGLLVLGMCFWNFVFWCCVEIQKQISDGIDSRVLVGLWAEGGVFCNDLFSRSGVLFWVC